MVKLLKSGRVVVVTAGRHAGQKAIVVSFSDSGTRDRSFGHALVAGIERPPLKVHKKMSKKKIAKRCSVKAFIKTINYTHLMPTRYTVSSDFDTKTLVGEVSEEVTKKQVRKNLQKVFIDKFLNVTNEKTGKTSKDVVFLRKKLRF